jgi:hypothetical protein
MIPANSTLIRTVLVAVTALAAAACGEDTATGGGSSYWVDTYNPAGLPATYATPAQHTVALGHPGNCLNPACHVAGGTAVLKLAWGGVVYQADGKTRANNVQVGVVSGSYRSFVYSRSDGLYWAEGTPPDTATWDAADIRIRNANGEKPKLLSHTRGADCDSCHKETGGSATALKTL